MTTKRTPIATLVFILIGLTLLAHGCAVQSGSSPPTAQDQPPQLVAINAISSSESADATLVTISADGPVTFSSFKKPDPPAVVLILPATNVDGLAASPMLDSALIQKVDVSAGNGGRTARIEFQLADDASYTARQEGNTVLLAFSKLPSAGMAGDSGSPAPEAASSPQPAAEPPLPPASQVVSTARPTPGAAPVAKTTAWVNKIDFLGESQGKSTLVLGTTHAVDYRINKIGPRKIQIRLLNTRIPSYRQRALITTRFNSAVDRVVPYQRAKDVNETIVSIELREPVPYYAEQTDNLLMVHFEASSVPPKPLEQAQLPAWKQSLASDEGSPRPIMPPGQTIAPSPVPAPAMQPSPAVALVKEDGERMEEGMIQEDIELRALLAPRKKKYTGEKIALDFYDTDIKNVFRILREVSGKNFAIDKDVTGKVTMTLDQPVPWDQVLDLVLRMNQLGMTYEGDIVRIATLETLKKEDDLRKAKLESLRKAREEARALEPLVTRYIAVSYSSAKEEVKPHIEKILTDGRGSVTVDEKNNQVIITDTVQKVRQAQEIIRRIDKVTAQVIIEARVVEVNQDFSKELGIKWDMTYGPGVIDGLGWNSTTDVAMNFPSTGATSSIGMSFSRLSGVPFVLNARINALETTGNGRILSSPKILTLDNKKAMIKQGLQYAYLERDSSGGSSVKFKDVDLLLEVTPHVTPDDRISLVILLTKNDVDSITDGVPNLATNEAQTELLVNDGDTVVIGGIVKKTEATGSSGFPVLSKIPVLGWAFKKQNNSTSNDELLIFITPRIVQLEQQQQMANDLN